MDTNLLNEDSTNIVFPIDRTSFTVYGNYSFLANGSSSTVTVSIDTALLTSDIQGSFNVNTYIDGLFAFSSPTPVSSAPIISQFSTTSDFADLGGTNTVSLPSSPLSLPITSNFPSSALELTGASSAIATIPQGEVYQDYLQQDTTITFTNVVAGETIDIQLPATTSLTVSSVPEPSTLVLLALGLLLPAVAFYRRAS